MVDEPWPSTETVTIHLPFRPLKKPWIDCLVYTDHLARFGAREISRAEYLQMLSAALDGGLTPVKRIW